MFTSTALNVFFVFYVITDEKRALLYTYSRDLAKQQSLWVRIHGVRLDVSWNVSRSRPASQEQQHPRAVQTHLKRDIINSHT